MSARLTLALFLCLGACDPAAESDVPGGPPWLQLGAGDRGFSPLDDGDVVDIVLGPQGGYMVALAIRSGGLVAGDPSDAADPDNPRVTFRMSTPDGIDLGLTTLQQGLEPVEADVYERSGAWVVFNASVHTDMYFGQEVLLEVVLVDVRGERASDSVRVRCRAPRLARLLQLDVDPRVVVGGARHHAERPAGEVGHPEQEAVHAGRPQVHPDTALERLVAHLAARRVVDPERQLHVFSAQEEQLVAADHLGVVGARDVDEDVAGERPRDGVGPLHERALAEQEVVPRDHLASVLAHREATVGARHLLTALDVQPVPAGALERVAGALLEDERALAARRLGGGVGLGIERLPFFRVARTQEREGQQQGEAWRNQGVASLTRQA